MVEPAYDAIWPLGPKHAPSEKLPERLDTLSGKVVAELWDYLYEGDRAFPILRDELRKQFPNVTFVEFPVFGNIHGADELEVVGRLPETLAAHGVDAVICGVGHCGSCTAATVRASVAAELAGYPTVSIVGSLFETQANLVSGLFGIEQLPLAVYPGRIPMDDDEVFHQKISTTIFDQVVHGLTGGEPRLVEREAEPTPRETVVRGSLDVVNDHFYDQHWTDGLPIVPPTVDRVDAFLAQSNREPEEVLGVLQPGVARSHRLERGRERRHGRLSPGVHATARSRSSRRSRSRTSVSSTRRAARRGSRS